MQSYTCCIASSTALCQQQGGWLPCCALLLCLCLVQVHLQARRFDFYSAARKNVSSPFSPFSKTYIKCGWYTRYSVLVKRPEQPIRQHLRLSFDELFTAMCRTLFNSDSMGSYGSERLSYLLGWPSLQGPTRIPVNHQKFESYTSCLLIVRATLPILVIGQNQKCRREGWYCYAYLVLL